MCLHKQRLVESGRRGGILVLSAFLLVVLLTIMALVVDIGYRKVTRTHLQAASDSSSLASVQELPAGLGIGATKTPAQASTAARASAVAYAARHKNGDVTSTYADPNRDVEIGNAIFDAQSGTWTITVGSGPLNMVRVSLKRNQTGSGNADSPLPLFFSGLLGRATVDVDARATAALVPGSTFRIPPGSGLTSGVLPFAIDLQTWNQMLAGNAPDNYSYNASNNTVAANQSDGIREVDIYPHDSATLPNSGNRGTVDLGAPNNSTSEIKRQIINGLNENDLSYFDGEISASEQDPLIVNGETGLSAGFKAELEAIIGQPRAVPLFTTTTNESGNNADFTIVKFVAIRIVAVRLNGNNKYLYAQPATLVDPTVVPDPSMPIESDSIFATPMLIE